MQIILLGEPISATEALNHGLVTKLFESGQVLKGVLETASKLANLSASALSFAKEAVLRGMSRPVHPLFKLTFADASNQPMLWGGTKNSSVSFTITHSVLTIRTRACRHSFRSERQGGVMSNKGRVVNDTQDGLETVDRNNTQVKFTQNKTTPRKPISSCKAVEKCQSHPSHVGLSYSPPIKMIEAI